MTSTLRISLLTGVLVLMGGCAAAPAKKDPRDPWERVNRTTYKFNDHFDRWIAKPIAHGYHNTVPQFMQTGIANFFDNASYTITIVNDLLQGQFLTFGKDTGRLVMNSTLGLAGFFDPASSAGLEKNYKDFGMTMGKWGAPTGPYVVIPFLGPSDVRDGLGRIADEFSDPRHYIQNDYWDYGLYLASAVNTRAQLISAEGAWQQAYDPYAFLRNAYLQRRDYLINGAKPNSDEEKQEEELLKDAGDEDNAADKPGSLQASPDQKPAPAPQTNDQDKSSGEPPKADQREGTPPPQSN